MSLEILKLISNIRKNLDRAQDNAFVHSLSNRLSVIQGPPGCGKTFIGCKILEVLLKFDLVGPVLVMTYKNHALDEFLLHTSKFCDLTKITRIGGRSKEPRLAECNLRNIDLERSSNSIFSQYKDQGEIIAKSLDEIGDHLYQVDRNSVVNEFSILRFLNEVQLHNLLTKQPEFASRKQAVQEIQFAISISSSLQEYVKDWFDKKLDAKVKRQFWCADMLVDAIRKWLPNKELLRKVKDIESTFHFEREKDLAACEGDQKASGKNQVYQNYLKSTKRLLIIRFSFTG